jgi:arylsulfatase A-like enzyme
MRDLDMPIMRHRITFILCLVGGALACSETQPQPSPTSAAGANFFQHVSTLETLAGFSEPQLDPSAASRLTALMKGEMLTLDVADWRPEQTLSGPELVRLFGAQRAETLPELRRWTLTPPVDLDMPWGEVRFQLGDQSLRRTRRRLTRDAAEPTTVWRDAALPLLLWWNAERRLLEAASPQPPDDLRLGYPAGLGPFPMNWEWWTSAPHAAELLAVTLGAETRRVLAVPTPSRLGFSADRLESASLDVGFALADFGMHLVDGSLRRRTGPKPEVVFAVDVFAAGETHRVWSKSIGPLERFAGVRVDISPWKGQACRVELVTESASPRAECFAMWTLARFRDERAATPARPHIVILDLDTLRADGLGCYGNSRDSSPNIDAWAAREAVLFSDHTSMGNWTLPSTASMLTGLPPKSHGLLDFPHALDARHRPLAQRLHEAGYETLGRTEAGVLAPQSGFDTGFERFVARAEGHLSLARKGWDQELNWLRRRDSAQPVFLFVQTYEVHGPFANDDHFDDPDDPYTGPLSNQPVRNKHLLEIMEASGGELPERDARYLRDVYDAGVRRVDSVVGRFLDALPEVFGDEPYVVVITSDHGEELGERGVTGHHTSLHGDQLRVPLIIRAPGQTGGQIVNAPVSALDLVPTLLALAGLPRDESLPGRALFEDALEPDAIRVMQHDEHGFAIRLMEWKLIEDAEADTRQLGVGLYDLSKDPGEWNSLAEAEPRRLEFLSHELARHREQLKLLGVPRARGGNEDERLLEQLKQLGYVEGR